MATKNDIDSNVTLEIDGDLPSPNQLATAITAFSALLNNAHKEIEGKTIQWGVQVKQGSNLIGYVPTSHFNPIAAEIVVKGIKDFEQGCERPNGFTDAMMYNLLDLCEVAKTTKKKKTTINVWINKERFSLSENVKTNLNLALRGAFAEYGSIEGRLETLESHGGYQFAVYEPLRDKKIICNVASDDISVQAHGLWEQRVEVEGMIKYSADGFPYEIRVEKLYALVPPDGIPDYKLTRGILKHYG